MIDDVQLNKRQIIQRCLRRVREEYADDPGRLEYFTHQDAIVLNLQRACEAAISLAMHFVAKRGLGIPQTSREAFSLLQQAGLLSEEVSNRMQKMVGFRNLAIHQYQDLDYTILQHIIDERLVDFESFLDTLLPHSP